MNTRHSRKTHSLATQSAELAMAVPQVMAHRLTRMALAGPSPSARDQREMSQMMSEKSTAFFASWSAMAMESIRTQQALATSVMGMWSPAGWGQASMGALASQMHGAALSVLGQGLRPVHRKAVANAKRLARTPLR
ncbi:hypothetical protein LRH25_03090 [Ideonella azotifigens]|nr:polyhydroxyalkanoate granule-associated phasin [Ideonella azotifigens]MCD2339320.1 hypothetical protein [Ideonella azotifigens]